MFVRKKLVAIASALVMIGLSGCGNDSARASKEQERSENRKKAEAEIQREMAEALSKGAVLLTKSLQGEVTIETYEIPRPRYILGRPFGLTKDICVVYQKRGQSPLMNCYPSEKQD